MEELSGDKPEDAIGLNVFELDSYKKVGLDKLFAKGLAGEAFETEVEYVSQLSKKSSMRYYRGVPLKGNSKVGNAKLLLIVEDITQRKKTGKN